MSTKSTLKEHHRSEIEKRSEEELLEEEIRNQQTLASFVEVFKIGKLLSEKLDKEFDISRKWASKTYSILKKRQAERKIAGV